MKKDLEYYLALKYPIKITPEEDGTFFIEHPDLPGCFSCGDTIDEAIESLKEAKIAWIEMGLEHGDKIPEPKSLEEFSGQFRLRIPKTLHKSLAEQAEKEEISMNQYCLYLLSKEFQKNIDKGI